MTNQEADFEWEAQLLYTTVAEYERDCPTFCGETGDEVLPPETPITINPHDNEWCVGHYDGNQTWMPLS